MDTDSAGNTWALVLAAGEGSRLRGLTSTQAGEHVPKQFWSLAGGESLLRETFSRARHVASHDSLCVVLAREHESWWQSEVAGLPPRNVFVQPRNRGTGIGILLPLLEIAERDPAAKVVILPADHHVGDEDVLRAGIRRAIELVEEGRHRTLLLGVDPTSSDGELGLMLTTDRDEGHGARLQRFCEKPAPEAACRLLAEGALWNTFIIVAQASALLDLIRRRWPIVVTMLELARDSSQSEAVDHSTVKAIYECLPTVDFSADVLAGQESQLGVLHLPPCGWSDLGTTARILSVLRKAPDGPSLAGESLLQRSDPLSFLRRCRQIFAAPPP